MDYGKIRQALETKLQAFPSALPIVFENVTAAPDLTLPHLRCYQLNAATKPMGIGSAAGRWYQGLFQINVLYPLGAGPVFPEDTAAKLCGFFSSGLQLASGGIVVKLEEPYVGKQLESDGWYIFPVYVRWFSLVEA